MTPRLSRSSMNSKASAAIVCMAFLMQAETSVADLDKAVLLNNEGVKALNSGNFSLAMKRFEEALELNPKYELARENLAIVRKESGWTSDEKKRMWQLRQKLFFAASDPTIFEHLEIGIKGTAKDPKSFEVRMALAEDCKNNADYIGAYIEYLEAIKLRKSDARARESLIGTVNSFVSRD